MLAILLLFSCLFSDWLVYFSEVHFTPTAEGAALHMNAHSLWFDIGFDKVFWLSFLWKHPVVFNNALVPKLLYKTTPFADLFKGCNQIQASFEVVIPKASA